MDWPLMTAPEPPTERVCPSMTMAFDCPETAEAVKVCEPATNVTSALDPESRDEPCESRIVLLPPMIRSLGSTLMDWPLMTAPEPPADRVCPSMTTAFDCPGAAEAVNVCEPATSVASAPIDPDSTDDPCESRKVLVPPIIKPLEPALTDCPLITAPGPPADRVSGPTTIAPLDSEAVTALEPIVNVAPSAEALAAGTAENATVLPPTTTPDEPALMTCPEMVAAEPPAVRTWEPMTMLPALAVYA